MKDKKYYHKINNLDIELKGINRKYIMIHQLDKTSSYKWGIASFEYEEDEGYWYLRTYGNFNSNVNWYDFGCLVNLGYKWIEELGWNK